MASSVVSTDGLASVLATHGDVTDVAYWRGRAERAEARVAELSGRLSRTEARAAELDEQVAVRPAAVRPVVGEAPGLGHGRRAGEGGGEPGERAGRRGQRPGARAPARPAGLLPDYSRLKTREEIHDVPAEERVCPRCGKTRDRTSTWVHRRRAPTLIEMDECDCRECRMSGFFRRLPENPLFRPAAAVTRRRHDDMCRPARDRRTSYSDPRGPGARAHPPAGAVQVRLLDGEAERDNEIAENTARVRRLPWNPRFASSTDPTTQDREDARPAAVASPGNDRGYRQLVTQSDSIDR
jgi:hypothetical protein